MRRPSVDSGDSAEISLSEPDSDSGPDSDSDPEPGSDPESDSGPDPDPDSGSDPGHAQFPIPTFSGGVMLQKNYKIHNFTKIIP